jgi:hypothetical protein
MFKQVTSVLITSLIAGAWSVGTLYLTKEKLVPKIKMVSMVQLINDKEDSSYQAFVDGKITDSEYQKLQENKMELIQKAIDIYSKDSILLMEEMVVKNGDSSNIKVESITERVKDYVKTNIYSSSK